MKAEWALTHHDTDGETEAQKGKGLVQGTTAFS